MPFWHLKENKLPICHLKFYFLTLFYLKNRLEQELTKIDCQATTNIYNSVAAIKLKFLNQKIKKLC
jgi:hypothetical protein